MKLGCAALWDAFVKSSVLGCCKAAAGRRRGWHGLAAVQAAVESVTDAGSPSVKMCFRAKMLERIVGGVKKKKKCHGSAWFGLVLGQGVRNSTMNLEVSEGGRGVG